MNLKLPMNLAANYKSASQIARVTTEAWVVSFVKCPNCGRQLKAHPSNMKSKDVFCISCKMEFQIKSSKTKFRKKIVGAEYKTTLRSVLSGDHPSLMLLHYAEQFMTVVDLLIIHRSYINESCIIPRKPLGNHAQRAGWQGCVIDLDKIPSLARIFLVKDGKTLDLSIIEGKWHASNKIIKYGVKKQGWISDVLRLVDSKSDVFTLQQMYAHEKYLSELHPNNHNIQAKIRQQLQIIRDMGLISFEGKGVYMKQETIKIG